MATETHTKFAYLDPEQRKNFRDRYDKVRNMYDKWHWSGHTNLFQNKKDLEQELIDLEDLSLAAYRALKCLRQAMEKNEAMEDQYNGYESERYSG